MGLNVVLILILLCVIAFTFADGLWSNALQLINVVTAGVIATNFFEPVAEYLTDLLPPMVHCWDVLALGVLFALAFVVLRAVTSALSRYRVLFQPTVDKVGSILLAALVGWTAVCFTTFALHTSPLSRNFLGGGFQPEQRMFFGTAPDRRWIAFVQRLSNDGAWGRNAVDENGNVTSVFDSDGEMLIKYATRRSLLEKEESTFYSMGN